MEIIFLKTYITGYYCPNIFIGVILLVKLFPSYIIPISLESGIGSITDHNF